MCRKLIFACRDNRYDSKCPGRKSIHIGDLPFTLKMGRVVTTCGYEIGKMSLIIIRRRFIFQLSFDTIFKDKYIQNTLPISWCDFVCVSENDNSNVKFPWTPVHKNVQNYYICTTTTFLCFKDMECVQANIGQYRNTCSTLKKKKKKKKKKTHL